MDLPFAHLPYQGAQVHGAVPALRLDGSGVGHGLSHVLEGDIQRVAQGVDEGWLAVSGEDHALTVAVVEIVCDGLDPPPGVLGQRGTGAHAANADFGGEGPGETLHVAGAQRNPMVGDGAGGRGHGLRDVEPVHCRLTRFAPWSPPGHELTYVAQVARAARQEVRV